MDNNIEDVERFLDQDPIVDEKRGEKVLKHIQSNLKLEEMNQYAHGFVKCACGCGKPMNQTRFGHRKVQQRYKELRDEFFVRLLEEGASLEVAAWYMSEDAQREAILQAKQGKSLNRRDIHDLGFYPREVMNHGTLQRRALYRLTRLPVELKKRVLEAAPKAIVRMYSLLDAKKPVYKDGVKVADAPDNEVQFKSAKDILDRTLGRPDETLKIEQEVKQFTVSADATQKLDDDFAVFLKQKYGKKKDASASKEEGVKEATSEHYKEEVKTPVGKVDAYVYTDEMRKKDEEEETMR